MTISFAHRPPETNLFDLLVDQRQDELTFSQRQAEMAEFLDRLADHQHLHYRRATVTGSAPMVRLQAGTTDAINLASNDYLNLSRHPAVIKAAIEASQHYGLGTGASPVVIGNTDLHLRLESELALFTGCESALLFSSGYGMNCGVLSGLLRRNDLAILDSAVHASLIDGCKGVATRVFDHNDTDDLARLLSRTDGRYANRLVVVEGVYSMDGDLACLDRILDVAHAHDAWVMVDEAHATGVIGATGRGTAEHFGRLGEVDIVAGTLSKSLGSVGGFVAGRAATIRYLQMSSRSYVFSTAIAPSAVAGALASLEAIAAEPQRRDALLRNTSWLREGLMNAGFDLGRSARASAILPVSIRDDYRVKELCRMLHEDNVLATPVVFPGVPAAESRVRLSVTSELQPAHLARALDALCRHGQALGIVGRRPHSLEWAGSSRR